MGAACVPLHGGITMRRGLAAGAAISLCVVFCLLFNDDATPSLSRASVSMSAERGSAVASPQELVQEPDLDAFGHMMMKKHSGVKKKKRPKLEHFHMRHMFDDDSASSDPLMQAEVRLPHRSKKKTGWYKLNHRNKREWSHRVQLLPNERNEKARKQLQSLEAAPKDWRAQEKKAKVAKMLKKAQAKLHPHVATKKVSTKKKKTTPKVDKHADHPVREQASSSPLDMLRTAAHAIAQSSPSKKKSPPKLAHLPDGLHATVPFKGPPLKRSPKKKAPLPADLQIHPT